MKNIYIDTVLQVFESDGNLHIVGGSSSGDSDVKGNDLVEKAIHLVMPMSKALRILPDIVKSLPQLAEEEMIKNSIAEGTVESKSVNESEGEGLHFEI
jgi:hypothetical protein|tara:strand:+ start:795 stop:1088 length:294 start_codon:yes stop_codon:yes gene_type:complete